MYSDQRRQPIGWIPAGALALSLLVGCKPAAAPSGAPTADAAATVPAEAADVAWFEGSVEAAFAAAKAESKPLFLYWGAVWCPPCHYLMTKVFHQPDFVAKSRDFVAVYLDGDTEGAQTWGETLNVSGYPTVLVMSPAGEELLRVPNGLGSEHYAAVLDRAKAMTQPIDAVLKAVQAAGPAQATPEQLALLAYYDWDLDARIKLEDAPKLDLFRRLWAETPAEQEAVKTRFLKLYLTTLHGAREAAAEADPPTEPPGFADEDRAAVETQIGAFLADPALRNDNLDLLFYWSQETVDLLHPGLGSQRDTLLRAWADAAKAVEVDESLTVDDRLTALYPQLAMLRMTLPPTPTPPADAAGGTATQVAESLPAELLQHLRDQVAWAGKTVTDPGELQAVASTMIWLLDEGGQGEASQAVLDEAIGRSLAPHYYMSYRASKAKEKGDAAAAVEWSRKAWVGAEGRASRFQWGYDHLAMLMSQTPDDAATIEGDTAKVLDELLANEDAFANRNLARLKRLQTAIEGWNKDGAHADSAEKIRQQVQVACERFPAEGEDSPRDRCLAFLAPAAAPTP